MLKKQIFGIMWVLAVVFALYVFVDQKILKDYATRNSEIEQATSTPKVQEIKREVVSTPPLRATTTQKILKTEITAQKIIALTNIERQKIGLPALGENTLLDNAALAKAKDMFAKQYFEHISPTGENAGNFVEREGYDYIIIGENLASGGFKDAGAIVDAWMGSPGHKENILNPKYREMGASAILGKFEGKDVLFAVQIFGTPISICPKPDNASKSKIDEMSKLINDKKQIIDAMYQEIINTNKKDEAYNAKVDEYNIIIKAYNNLIAEAQNLITVYNEQVRQFTECADSLR